MATFSNRLKELRKEKGLTQKELAQILYVNQSAISKYELGTNFPENQFLVKLANLFDVSTDYLLGRTDKRSSKASQISIDKATEIIEEFSKRGYDIDNIDVDELFKIIKMYYYMKQNE